MKEICIFMTLRVERHYDWSPMVHTLLHDVWQNVKFNKSLVYLKRWQNVSYMCLFTLGDAKADCTRFFYFWFRFLLLFLTLWSLFIAQNLSVVWNLCFKGMLFYGMKALQSSWAVFYVICSVVCNQCCATQYKREVEKVFVRWELVHCLTRTDSFLPGLLRLGFWLEILQH